MTDPDPNKPKPQDRKVIPRWDYRQTSDSDEMEMLLDTGWEPFAVGEDVPLVIHFRRYVLS